MTPAGRVVALLGAESTGKSTLSRALVNALRVAQPQARVALVPEFLREFCETHGRLPTAADQAGIAAEQTRRIDAARLRHDWVVADTTALLTAVYSRRLLADDSLTASALQAHPRAPLGLTLLMGLDLPWEADGSLRDGPAVQHDIDADLRRLMLDHQLPFATLYGRGDARLEAAWRGLCAHWAEAELPPLPRSDGPEPTLPDGAPLQRRWRRLCLDCLEPGCEHLSGSSRPPSPAS